MDLEPEFWLVWNLARAVPTFKHDTLAGATAEAQRLAKMNPGENFFVAHAVMRFAVQMQCVELAPVEPF